MNPEAVTKSQIVSVQMRVVILNNQHDNHPCGVSVFWTHKPISWFFMPAPGNVVLAYHEWRGCWEQIGAMLGCHAHTHTQTHMHTMHTMHASVLGICLFRHFFVLNGLARACKDAIPYEPCLWFFRLLRKQLKLVPTNRIKIRRANKCSPTPFGLIQLGPTCCASRCLRYAWTCPPRRS